MACFIAPVAEAIVTTMIGKAVKEKERALSIDTEKVQIEEKKIPLSKKISWLNTMLWGGSGLLAFEHLWHGEITSFFPFLTAMSNKEDAFAMLHEISTVGVSMAVLVTAVWGIMCFVVHSMETSAKEETVLENTGK